MEQRPIQHIKTISEFHRLRGLAQPEHPLLSVVDYAEVKRPVDIGDVNLMFDFYQISVKRGMNATLKYGQQAYDFEEGVMFFAAPNQVLNIQPNSLSTADRSGWILLIHPDFFWHTSLAKTIKQYDFFGYSVNEALWLSTKEEATINRIIDNIKQEYTTPIDAFSKQIIIDQIESLLSYSKRFYHRQFITRELSNHQLLAQLDNLLTSYLTTDDLVSKGLPTVHYIADQLNVSPKYLSNLLNVLIGQSTQQYIHKKLIEQAKEKLSTTTLSVSEVSYGLGFEHSQSFNKFFKAKTNQSPLEFRRSFQ
ncbi:helix-turn-helix domain-containing protein [Spirosoma endophyticum]|uniref:Helix-turn-helix domain-containing protein n=1 Tax=Spirosoma endophyticum TaxID=662367 RepID=A0A1I2H1Q6_9BACT|nr:helix-turn-helix transcriptional regulator [Spirosoma endophyticum]SFF23612.1 Helix-turn-helix domain-containing protein [Spirosoma endophyticum]